MLADATGINGPRFVAVYGVAAALVIAYALVRRAAALRGGDAGRPPTPPELAYLNGGPALAALRRDLIGAGWLVSVEQRRRARASGWTVLGLALLGGMRIAGDEVDSVHLTVLLLTLAIGATGGALLLVGPRTLAGTAASAALDVAVHGPAALWAAGALGTAGDLDVAATFTR